MLMEKTASTTRLDARACSGRGRRRHNADATATHHDPGTGQYAFAIADGIGDTEAAAQAAHLAAGVAARAVSRPSPTSAVAQTGTVNALLAARAAVRAWVPDDPAGLAGRVGDARPVGDAVLVVATLLPPHLGGGFSVAWAGDSRAYLWNGATLTQLTADQTVAEYLRSRGQPAAPRMRHIVTNSVRLSTPETIGHITTGGTRDSPGLLVLTTDGVHGKLDHERLAEIIGGAGDSRATAAQLVLAALHAGGTDNATALVVDPAPRLAPAPTSMDRAVSPRR